MNLVIWGYGLNGEKCRDILSQNFPEDRIICFIDNDRAKINDTSAIPVLPAGALRILTEEKLVDKIIIPGYEPAVYREIYIQLYQLNISHISSLLFYAEIQYFQERTADCRSFAEILRSSEKVIPLVGAIEVEVCETCNLNCKRCNHYSNIFSEGKMMSPESFERDVKRLSELVYNIKRFKLLGGEPLLNPELHRFVRISRQYLKKAYIAIITNGLLVRQMPAELIDAIKETGTVIEISVYPPVKDKIEPIIRFLEERGLTYKIFRNGDEFGAYLNLKGDSDKDYAMTQCYAQVCHALKDGKIYKCASGQNIHVLNQKYGIHLPETGLDFRADSLDAKELYNYLNNTVELCRYCTTFVYHDWEMTRNDALLADWVAEETV